MVFCYKAKRSFTVGSKTHAASDLLSLFEKVYLHKALNIHSILIYNQ